MRLYGRWFALAIWSRAKFDPCTLLIFHIRIGRAGIDWRRVTARENDPFETGHYFYYTWWM